MTQDILWPCKPRTAIKLKILEKYLSSWFTILGNSGYYRRAIYIDTFCGPGQYATGEDGSPIVALKHGRTASARYRDFNPSFHFIDNDKNAIDHLKSIPKFQSAEKYFNSLYVYTGDFPDLVDTVIRNANIGKTTPVFSFVDPFGIGASPFTTISKLLPNKHSEMFVNFMGGWANRFINHSDKLAQHVEGLLGGNFVERVLSAPDRTEEIYKIYVEQLSSIVPFVKRFQLFDETGQKDNALIFCGYHPKGYIAMKKAMWAMDPVHGQNFSEKQHAIERNFISLLPDEPYLAPLRSSILKQFAQQRAVKMYTIDEWVENETNYLTTHLRKSGGLMETLYNEGKIKYFDKEGKKKVKNNWPQRLLIDFL